MKIQIVLCIVLIIITLAFAVVQAHLWFNAPCEIVKQYWYLTHVPGRCL